MLNGVIEWFKAVVGDKEVDVIKKNELLMGMENLHTVIEENVKPTIDQIEGLINDGVIDDKTLVRALKLMKIKVKDGKDFIRQARFNAGRIEKGIEDVVALIEDYIPNVLVTDALTIRQSAILTLTCRLDGATGFISDMLMFIAYDLNGDKNVVYPNFSKRVSMEAGDFSIIMKSLSEGNIYDKVSNLSDVKISADKSILRETATDYDLRFSLPTNNFNGNPFYFLGKWWVDFELKRANRYRDMKKITSYKLIQLREKKENGDVSTSIDKQIDYYEQRLKQYDAKIRKLEE